MALLLRCAPQLRSLELLTEAAWPEAMTSTSRQERAHHPEEEEEEEEEDDEQPSSRRRLMLPAISEAEFRDCEALLAGRNSEPSRSLQRLAIVDAVHATVEQVLLPLIRGSGCGVESVRVWLCNAADSKRVVLEALASNAGAVRDVVVPHNAVDDTLLRQLARDGARTIRSDQASALCIRQRWRDRRRARALRPAAPARPAARVPRVARARAARHPAHRRVGACRRPAGALARVWLARRGARPRATTTNAKPATCCATASLQYLWVHTARRSRGRSHQSPFVSALPAPLAARVVHGQFQGLAVLTSAIRVRWHEKFHLSAGQRDLAFPEFERQD